MNRPSQVIRPRISSQQPVVGEKGGEGYTRSVGRNFIMALYGSLRSIRMYPIENPVVQKGLDELTAVTEELRDAEGDLEFRVSGEFIFVNSTRLRLDLDNYTTLQLPARAVPRVRRRRAARESEAVVARLDGLPLVPSSRRRGRTGSALRDAPAPRLDNTGVLAFEVSPPVESEDDQKVRVQSKESGQAHVRAVGVRPRRT